MSRYVLYTRYVDQKLSTQLYHPPIKLESFFYSLFSPFTHETSHVVVLVGGGGATIVRHNYIST